MDHIAHFVDAAIHAVVGFFQSGLRAVNRVSKRLTTLFQIVSERRRVSNLDALFLQELINVLIEIVFSQFLHTLSSFEKSEICQIMAAKESMNSKFICDSKKKATLRRLFAAIRRWHTSKSSLCRLRSWIRSFSLDVF